MRRRTSVALVALVCTLLLLEGDDLAELAKIDLVAAVVVNLREQVLGVLGTHLDADLLQPVDELLEAHLLVACGVEAREDGARIAEVGTLV